MKTQNRRIGHEAWRAWAVCAAAAAVVLAAAAVPQQPASARPQSAASARQPATTAARPADATVPFAPGETLAYEVTWSNLLTAGTATVTVHDKRPSAGGTAYYVTAEGRPSALVAALYPVYYKADTLLDTVRLRPQRASIYSDERGRRHHRITRFDAATKSIHYEEQTGDPPKVTSRLDQPAPADAQDALSAIFYLRTARLAPGAAQSLPVVVNGHLYRVEVKVDGRERVRCGLGDVEAWRVTPTLLDERDRDDGKDLVIWISADARRLPVRLQGALPVGAFALTLTSVQDGAR